jgi:pilus assembly protein Flp/PilA
MLNIVTAIMIRLQREEKAASSVEYAIVVGLVGAAVVTAVKLYTGSLSTLFTGLMTKATTGF